MSVIEFKNHNEEFDSSCPLCDVIKVDGQLYVHISKVEVFQNLLQQKELCKVWAERDNAYRIINELEKSWKEEITRFNNFIQEDSSMIEINNIRKMLIQEREKDLYKLQELKESNEPSFEEMVNFVENVCQDIKSQSTLDEKLEEERERIAKIVNDFKGADKE